MPSLRAGLNRVLMPAGLTVALPLIGISGLVHPGLGGRVAQRAARDLARLLGVRLEIRGAGHLHPGQALVLCPNHSSALDVPALLAADPEVRFAAAAELFGNPVLAAAMRGLRTIPIDRSRHGDARRALADVAASIEPGARLVVFPEGRMAPPGTLLPFKTGAAALAVAARASIVPVAIHNASALMPRDAGVAVRPGRVVVELLEPIPTDDADPEDRRRLRDRTREAVASALRLEDGGGAASRPELGSL